MIELSALTFKYPGQDPSLSDIYLELAPGRTLGLVGANGSGKSTLLALLAGLLTPVSGRLSLNGHESPGDEKSIRRLVGLVMQDADLQILGGTVEEDLFLGIESAGEEEKLKALELAERFQLTACLANPVQALSWGQKKRLCLAAILRQEPRVLLLDEPFSGLDYAGIREMRRVIDQNKQAGLTQIVAAHDLEPLADLADEWAVLSRGRLVLQGRPADVFDQLLRYEVRPPCSWQAGLGVRPWE